MMHTAESDSTVGRTLGSFKKFEYLDDIKIELENILACLSGEFVDTLPLKASQILYAKYCKVFLKQLRRRMCFVHVYSLTTLLVFIYFAVN